MAPRLRVGIVFYTHPSFRERAIPHVVSEIAEELARRGHDVVAYCPVDAPTELASWRGLRLIGVPCRTIQGPRWAIGVELPLRVAFRLDPGLDAIVLNGEPGAWIPFLLGRRYGIAGVLAIHGLVRGVLGYRNPRERRLRHRDRLLRAVLGAGEWLSARTADLCVAGSRRLVPELIERLGVDPRRVVPVPNGVAPRAARTLADRDEARHRLGLPSGVFYAAFVGADHRRKGLEVARAAVVRAQTMGAPVVLLTAGNYAPPIASEVRYGWVDEPTKWAILTAADAFLFPTRYEAYSLAVREAAAVGLPIVTTPASGVDEGVEGRDYLLHEPGDVEGFATALVRLYREPAWAAEVGVRGHAELARWTFADQARGWEAAIARLAQAPRRPRSSGGSTTEGTTSPPAAVRRG